MELTAAYYWQTKVAHTGQKLYFAGTPLGEPADRSKTYRQTYMGSEYKLLVFVILLQISVLTATHCCSLPHILMHEYLRENDESQTLLQQVVVLAYHHQFLSDGLLASKPEVRTPIGAARKLDCIISQPSPGSSTDL